MRLKNREIHTLTIQMAKMGEKNFPVKISFAIAKNRKKMAEALEIIEEQRKKLCEKYAARDENGEIRTEKDVYVIADHSGLNTEYKELLEVESDMDLMQIALSDLERCGEGKYDAITPDEADVLQFFCDAEK